MYVATKIYIILFVQFHSQDYATDVMEEGVHVSRYWPVSDVQYGQNYAICHWQVADKEQTDLEISIES